MKLNEITREVYFMLHIAISARLEDITFFPSGGGEIYLTIIDWDFSFWLVTWNALNFNRVFNGE